MFAKSHSSTHRNAPCSEVNLIASGTLIRGHITSAGDIRIDGKLDGTLSTDARVVVGKEGEIHGDIVCKSADIMGKVKGTIRVEDLLSLKETAVVEGDIYTHRLEMAPSAVFNGQCKMEASTARTQVSDLTDEEPEITVAHAERATA
ncbi:cytoskeletal protein CcmA (bactofilin family) [Thermoflavifilum aggregans]|uniref:Cytoskeletal protein CcmA (Bactofilin family) n=1 Tax=Thermoflavifilum aggregans TaxID=454188 RepID=A0A2M9CX87_9BACT|nr:polymer-forming cytoskeletal protein [Thermoflavifilum aggregans]MBX6381258.1 polymer-forming cytoskeletal protein [Thermoflavifilum aggregans]PJJ76503.1 cytoskeletal protein CcmA (bactofilin family) [Thermoflavifilum aggregans]